MAGTYTPSATSNRLNTVTGSPARTFTYDAAGNTLTFSTTTFAYNNRGRMKSAKVGSSTTDYYYNALGQRIQKAGGPAGTVLMVYDEAGHILGEYSGTGALVQETVWLGDTPVATIRPSGSAVAVYYVHADHLNAPRLVTQPSTNKIAWRWDTDPYGTVAPNQNPVSLGAFVYNLRFPGQYYDSETGLSYNYYRDFDPQTGRYVESDPIGLYGGTNPYAYTANQPILTTDPLGLCAPGTHPATPDDIKKILAEANKIAAKGLTHAQVQCNQFVDQSINNAFPNALARQYNTTEMQNGLGPFQPASNPDVGDLMLLGSPGHVVFVTGVSIGSVKQFLGSQSSTGPATVNLPNTYWSQRVNSPGNVSYLQICLPN